MVVIDRSELVELASEMIRIPSISGDEEAVARFLASWLNDRGVDATLQYAAPGRPNVIASIPGETSDPGLVLNGHLDTGPPLLGEDDPFEPRVEDGYLYGKGIYNMKGAVAAMAAAMAALRREKVRLARHVTLTAVVGEGDLFGLGTKAAIEGGPKAAAAICGEPTESMIRLRHTGLVQFRVIIEGLAAHQKERDRGVNAISSAILLYPYLREGELTFDEHPVDGAPQLLIGQIEGGTWPMITAPQCVLTGDVRTVSGMTEASVAADLERMIESAVREHREISATVETFVDSAPFEMSQDAEIISVLADVHARVHGSPVSYIDVRHLGVTDSSHLVAAGIPTALYGPGNFSMLEPDRISVEEMAQSAMVFALTAAELCGPEI